MGKLTISTYYETDHDRLDELFRQFQLSKTADFSKARECFRQFKVGLQRHIIWEEEILFPIFERKAGLAGGGPTRVMRMEHRMIEACLENLHDQVKLQNPATEDLERNLVELLTAHNMKEEQVLYPAIDNTIGGDELTHVFRSMESLAEDRYNA